MSNIAPKKILFVLPTLNAGGAERVLITLMNGIDEQKYEKHLIAVNDTEQLKHLINSNVSFYDLNKLKLLFSLFALHKTIKQIKPDLVVSTMAHMNFAILLLKPFFPKTKFIVREAITPSFFFEKYKSGAFLIKVMYKTLYPRADKILSPSKLIFKEFDEFMNINDKKCMPIFNPVDIDSLREQTEEFSMSAQRKETVSFICCGRLEKQKGYDRLFDALKNAELNYNWKLDIYGEGIEREALQSQIEEYNLSDKIELKGLVKKVSPLITQSDCFLLPSRFEGLPNVVLESLACGIKVIAMKESGGIHEIVENGAGDNILVTDTIEQFVAAMSLVKPEPTLKYKPSLLPTQYHKESAIKQFEQIISEII